MALFGSSWKDDVKGDDEGPLLFRHWKDDSEDVNAIPPMPLKQQLDQLTDEQRIELFNYYCKHCGSKKLPCHCANDE